MGKRGPQKGHGGRPRKSAADKILEGNPGKREIKVINRDKIEKSTDIDNAPGTLSVEGRNIYTKTIEYLKRLKCEDIVNPMLIESFALNRQRWLEIEKKIDTMPELLEDKDVVKISHEYQNQMRRSWSEIFGVVNDNCTENIEHNEKDDLEELLTS